MQYHLTDEVLISNNSIPPDNPNDGQAPARRFGALVAVVAVLCGLACLAAIWALFAKDSIDTLRTSIRLQSDGVQTTGRVVEAEKHPGVRPTSSGAYTLFVEYEADSQSYAIKSLAFYPVRDSSWVGESMPIIYDPQNPHIAQIDTFQERWLTPLPGVLP